MSDLLHYDSVFPDKIMDESPDIARANDVIVYNSVFHLAFASFNNIIFNIFFIDVITADLLYF